MYFSFNFVKKPVSLLRRKNWKKERKLLSHNLSIYDKENLYCNSELVYALFIQCKIAFFGGIFTFARRPKNKSNQSVFRRSRQYLDFSDVENNIFATEDTRKNVITIQYPRFAFSHPRNHLLGYFSWRKDIRRGDLVAVNTIDI